MKHFILFLPHISPPGCFHKIAVNSTQSTPDPSAMLDVQGTSKGVLFPRLTILQRIAITNPANGLHIFNTDFAALEFYDSLSREWVSLSQFTCLYHHPILNKTNIKAPKGFYRVYVITIDSSATIGGPAFTR